jgi:DNA invertase Pin-like site-specific DNA recombinase
MVMVLGMVAELERTFILEERQRTGIEAAKAKGGVDKRRKPPVPVDEVRRLRGEGKGPGDIADAPGLSRMSVWRPLNG